MKGWRCVVCAGLVLSAAGCQEKKARVVQEEAVPVRVQEVALSSIAESVEYVGDIRGLDEATVFPKVSGKVLEKVKQEGAAVSKGEVLLYLDRDEIGMQYVKAPVESPLTGVVGRLYVDIGSHVSAATPVALVVNMEKVKIVLDIPENILPRVQVGQRARVSVDAYAQEEFQGTVTKVSPVVSIENRAAPIEILLENGSGRLKSGMFAHVSLVLAVHEGVPVVPREAVLGKNAERFVYVVEDGKAALRPVTLGVRQGPSYEITSGLTAGDRVVIVGQQRLREGTAVVADQGALRP